MRGKAVEFSRQVEQTSPTDPSISERLIRIFNQSAAFNDLKSIYARLRKSHPQDPEMRLTDLILDLSLAQFATAQATAMAIAKDGKEIAIVALAVLLERGRSQQTNCPKSKITSFPSLRPASGTGSAPKPFKNWRIRRSNPVSSTIR
jgi:hypothetical protein